ncbi:MAG: response regulator, partial [Myxococcota bacterium]
GTTFTVLFPSLGDAAPLLAPEPDAPWRATGTVLVADDEDIVRTLFAEHLRSIGFDVLLAADGAEAVDLLRADPARVTLVVLDRTMPRLSGEATFRELRRLRPDLPVILSSGNEDEAATRALFAEGLSATLKKPYRRHDLVRTVRRVLEA